MSVPTLAGVNGPGTVIPGVPVKMFISMTAPVPLAAANGAFMASAIM